VPSPYLRFRKLLDALTRFVEVFLYVSRISEGIYNLNECCSVLSLSPSTKITQDILLKLFSYDADLMIIIIINLLSLFESTK
jgi:hypothetical protein